MRNIIEKIGRYDSAGKGDIHGFVGLAFTASDWVERSWERSTDNSGWGRLNLKTHDLVDYRNKEAPYRNAIDEVSLRIKGVLAAGKYAHEVSDRSGGVMANNELLDYEKDAQRAIAGVVIDQWLGTGKNDADVGDLVFNAFNSVVGSDNAFYWVYTAAIDKGLQDVKTEYRDIIIGEPINTIKFWREVGRGNTQLIFDDLLQNAGGKREINDKGTVVGIMHDVRSLIASKGLGEKRLVEKFEAMTNNRARFGIGLDRLSKIRNEALSTVVAQKIAKFGIRTKVDDVRVAEENYRNVKHEYALPVGASIWFGGFALLFEIAALEGLKRGIPMMPEPGSFGSMSPFEAIVASVAFATIAAPMIPNVFKIGRLVEAKKNLELTKAQ